MADDPAPGVAASGLNALTIDILIQDKGWLLALPPLEGLAREIVQGVLNDPRVWPNEKIPGRARIEVSLCFADDDFVCGLNREFRAREKPTNVLSFPSGELGGRGAGEVHLGDIVLALGVVTREAEDQAKPVKDHTAHLVTHGLLHLLGFDHDKPEDEAAMEALEINLLKTFGIRNPYE